MNDLGLAVGVFVLTHLIPAIRPLRRMLVGLFGERLYIALFSILSLAVIVWLGVAYAAAPYVELWPPVDELRWLPIILMPVACVLIAAGLSSRNPFSLGLGAAGFDANKPGIVALTRHPAVWGLVLWSAVHMVVNGDAASLVLFGLLTLLGFGGPKSLDAKRRKTMGAAEWQRLLDQVNGTPFGAALVQVGVGRVLLGLALYGVLLMAHEAVIGLSPLPF